MKRRPKKSRAKKLRISRRPLPSAKTAPPKRKTGRHPGARPKDDFEARLLSEYDEKIARFLHRDRHELRQVHDAAVVRGYPQVTKKEEAEIRERLRIEKVPKDEIARRFQTLRRSRSRDRDRLAWLLLQRFRESDAEFFELVTMVLAHPRTEFMNEREAALWYVDMAKAQGFTPTKNGFVKWLRDYAGCDVVKEARGYGQYVVHPETAARALKFVTAYRRSGPLTQ